MANRPQQPQGIAASRGHTVMDSFRDEVPQALQNSFIAGLKTEFTGLNFPPNSCTDVDNCVFTMLGDILRREGFNYEANFVLNTIDRTNSAINSYRWLNVGGDGETQVYVLQIGDMLYFFESSAATVADPLSTQLLASTITLSTFLASGSSLDTTEIEAQFSDGNGYLFVYHPYCDPFYCSFNAGTITASPISIKIRDFSGIVETGVPVDFRSPSLTSDHTYNLQNQGWTQAPTWTTVTTVNTNIPISPGDNIFTVAAGLATQAGDPVVLTGNVDTATSASGVVVSYIGTSMVINITDAVGNITANQQWTIALSNVKDLIDAWQAALGNYPSNADVWWAFKDSTDVFNPSATVDNIPSTTSPAPQGHFLLDAFNQQRSAVSGIAGLTDVTTTSRPRIGAWFQGRVWYAGVDASQPATGDQLYYTWTENIYFSQIVTDSSDFGLCYQTDDPTDENLFDLLPSDGGVIVIQGAGAIYKLFPIQNGMLVFAANGVWFITGSQGIGFSANDYTITKISAVQSISSTSFVDVQGLPVFWNQEGIYTVSPAQQGLGLTVTPLTVGTILTFYNNIPLDSKKYVKGAYNPITYILQWTYKSTEETDITSRYEFDSILCFNTFTKAFYPYTVEGPPHIHGVVYVANPGGSASPEPTFKYVTSVSESNTYNFTFGEERDTTYTDWVSNDNVGVDFNSYFITGYQLDGQGMRKWQPQYVYVYSRNTVNTSYVIQGLWDYSNEGNSGQQSVIQQTNVNKPYHSMTFRRHRIRGHGYVLQLKFSSISNQPFDIMGWAIYSTQNTGP